MPAINPLSLLWAQKEKLKRSMDKLIPKDEFNYAGYNGVKDRIDGRYHRNVSSTDSPEERNSYSKWQGAWNAVHFRSVAVVQCDRAYTRSFRKYHHALPFPQRCEQDNVLLTFFVCGLFALESAFFGLYAVGALIKPKEFSRMDINNPGKLKDIYPKTTTEDFEKAYPNDALTLHLRSLVNNSDFREWSNIRNVLTHREAPGRSHYYDKAYLNEVQLELDEQTTSQKRDWFFPQMNDLLTKTDAFVQANVV